MRTPKLLIKVIFKPEKLFFGIYFGQGKPLKRN